MRNRQYHVVLGALFKTGSIVAALVVCAGATAQQDNSGVDPLNQALRKSQASRAELLAGVWVPRLGGESRLDTGLGSTQIVFETELHLDDIEATPNLELTLRRNEYALHISGFDFSTSNRGEFDARPMGTGPQQFGSLTLADGDPIRSDFDFTSAAVELQFLNLGPLDEELLDDPDVTISLSPTIAARWVHTEQSISTSTASENARGQWLGFLIGFTSETVWHLDPEVPIVDWISFEFAVAIGPAIGGDGGFIWQVRGGLHVGITPEFGLLFGYRLVELDLDGNDFEIDGGLQGLFVAGSIRF